MDNINRHFNVVKNLIEIISLLIGVPYVIGFLIWSVYLFKLGFIESTFLQTRFLVTGFLFLFLLTSFILLLYALKKVFYFLIRFCMCEDTISRIKTIFLKNNSNFFSNPFNYLLIFQIIVVFLLYFSLYIFPRIHLVFGGGAPRVLALMGTEEEIKYLSDFNLKPAAGSKIQTENLCIAYENDNSVIIVGTDRIINLEKNQIKGFISLPSLGRSLVPFCKKLIRYLIF